MNENNSATELENNMNADCGDLAVSTNIESAINIQTKVSEKTKKSKLLLVSGILGTLYLIYLITYFMGGMATDDQAQVIAGGIATMLVMPHMLCVGDRLGIKSKMGCIGSRNSLFSIHFGNVYLCAFRNHSTYIKLCWIC